MQSHSKQSASITDDVIVAALNARWHSLHETSWTPKWAKSDKKAMRAAIETALERINVADA